MKSMKANFWMLIGVLAVFILFTSLANAGGGKGDPTVLPLKVDGWWEVAMFGTSLTQNKERGVVTEDMWVFAGQAVCQDTWCQADIKIFKEDGWKWKEVGSGNLSLPPSGNGLWYYFSFYETGDYYYDNIFHFGNEMEGGFQGDKWECREGEDYCILTYRSWGRITFKK